MIVSRSAMRPLPSQRPRLVGTFFLEADVLLGREGLAMMDAAAKAGVQLIVPYPSATTGFHALQRGVGTLVQRSCCE